MDEQLFSQLLKLLDTLIQIEQCMESYYSACLSAFPEDKNLWEGLRAEEANHAAWIAGIKEVVSEKRDQFELGKFNIMALETYRSGLEAQIERIKKGEMKRINAMAVARDYENTLVEKKFFLVVKSSLPEFNALTEKIEAETSRHFSLLEDYIHRM